MSRTRGIFISPSTMLAHVWDERIDKGWAESVGSKGFGLVGMLL